MADRQLKVTLVGDSRQLERTLGRTETRLQKFSKTAGGIAATGGFSGGGVLGIGRGGAFAAAAGVAVLSIKSVTDAAKNAEVILGQTSVAVEDAGLSWAKYGKQVEAAALSISTSSAFDDEQVLQSFQVFVRGQKDVAKSLTLSRLAADVARGRYTDLASATQLVNKAALGQIGALRRAGIAIDKNATSTEALAALQAAYGGAAVRYANSAAGAQDKLRVSVENLKESVGEGLLPALTDVVLLMNQGVLAADKFGAALAAIGDVSVPLTGDLENLAKRFAEIFPSPIQGIVTLHDLLNRGKKGPGAVPLFTSQSTDPFAPNFKSPPKGSAAATAFGQPGFKPTKTGKPATALSQSLVGQELDARLGRNRNTLKGVLAKEASVLQSLLNDVRLTPKQQNEIKSELLGVTSEIQGIDDAIISDAKDKTQAAKDAKDKTAKALAESTKKAKAALKAQTEAFKSQADDIKSAVLSAFDFKADKIHNRRDLEDAKKNLNAALRGGGKEGINLARREVQDAQLAIQRQRIENTAFRVTEGPKGPVNTLHAGNVIINFNGNVSDHKQVEDAVTKGLQRATKRGAPSQRGRFPGHHLGIN